MRPLPVALVWKERKTLGLQPVLLDEKGEESVPCQEELGPTRWNCCSPEASRRHASVRGHGQAPWSSSPLREEEEWSPAK